MSVSTRTRFEVLKRDGFRCRYCGASSIDVLLHVDHVVPRADEGTDDPSNLVAACAACNLGKSDVPLDEQRIAPSPSTDDAKEHAAQIHAYLDALREVDAARQEIYEYLADKWREIVGDDPPKIWYDRLGAITKAHPIERILCGIQAVADRVRYGKPVAQTKYFYGVMRRMLERGQ